MSIAPRLSWFFLLVIGMVGALRAQPVSGVRLPASARGNAAIIALGPKLPDVAKAYGLSDQELVTLLRTQPSLGVDLEGSLMFVCEGLRVTTPGLAGRPESKEVGDGSTTTSSGTLAVSSSTTDVFRLHSLPGAPRVIYLDFDGHTTSGTQWNSSFTGGAPIVSQPFDQDGSPSTFSAAERDVIFRIWQRVAEDYAPFSVNVTTEDPGVEALRRTNTSSDPYYGIRVVISPTNWYNTGAGGVAYLSSFTSSADTPCFAFTQQLANGEKYIAEAASHEIGHTVGLQHDGVIGETEYYQGHGNWAPIMGNSYYKPISQFSRGEYANANRSSQDDLAVIASFVPVTGDDHGNGLATASVLMGPNVADGGTIETRTDVDVFRLDAGAGSLSLSFSNPAPQPNLDIKAELLNASGSVLQSSDPAGLNASLSATLSAGTYYVRVSGVGVGDPVSNGYSDYGSVGNYIISGTFPVSTSTPKQAPVAAIITSGTSGVAPLTVNFSGAGSTDADGNIVSHQWNFGPGVPLVYGVAPGYTFTSAGAHTVVLTVTDNDGLTGTASVVINVSAPAAPNAAPVASASVTAGSAPLTMVFSSGGSFDTDGSIVAYLWTFGDSTSSTAANPTKTYLAPGTYTATLRVTDNAGATGSTSITVNVAAPPSNTAIAVPSITFSTTTAPSGTTVTTLVAVRDTAALAVAGVSVRVQWFGALSGSATGLTDANGNVAFSLGRTKKGGTITVSITSITPPSGYIYQGSLPVSNSLNL